MGCGASHYNMQMKIIVEEEKDFNKWISEQKIFAKQFSNKFNYGRKSHSSQRNFITVYF